MILVAHGLWDSKTDPKCGVSILAARLREMYPGIREIDVDEWPEFGPIELAEESNLYIGYSNGAHQLKKIHEKVMESVDDPEATNADANFIFLDFVYKGARQVFDRWPLQFPRCVESCWAFNRTESLILPPFHSTIIGDEVDLRTINNGIVNVPAFANIPVNAGHGNLPALAEVQDAVCRRVKEVMA